MPAAMSLFEPYGPGGERVATTRSRELFLLPPYNLITLYHASRSSVTTRDVEFEPAESSRLRKGGGGSRLIDFPTVIDKSWPIESMGSRLRDHVRARLSRTLTSGRDRRL